MDVLLVQLLELVLGVLDVVSAGFELAGAQELVEVEGEELEDDVVEASETPLGFHPVPTQLEPALVACGLAPPGAHLLFGACDEETDDAGPGTPFGFHPLPCQVDPLLEGSLDVASEAWTLPEPQEL